MGMNAGEKIRGLDILQNNLEKDHALVDQIKNDPINALRKIIDDIKDKNPVAICP
jgi:hypothetical protein